MPRFVVLEHSTPPGNSRPLHWDFMLESGDVLRTWALAAEPSTGPVVPAELLPDHRMAYLDYEGPVSGGRGTVRRWDAGSYEVVAETDDSLVLALSGQRLSGTARLSLIDDGDRPWQFEYSADPAP
jgi:hypothetical protein